MKNWSASAIDRYYLDPTIELLQSGNGDIRKSHVAGYYIVPHCSPDCCHAFGSLSTIDLGPFSTRVKARNWSRKNLADPGEEVH